jgi:rfaE bifunctional protein nucleotidyltransferase chain/domain|uniref:Bifunctional heptose 7-phosphate kinase/heptose 1-phosphate adenyltransferase n=1 Tax=uncultured marine virus TaxID=186617 RepID=A0A0F7LBI5_9VIRU|nr:bifunctional heptose 7-phosphate kinase/heptose 1-phosphate adenyltransferase [uncultured marine virus]
MQTIKKIWVNGCFDVLHRGHIELLRFAKNQGDYLVVGIDSDQRVKQNKGFKRPINTQEDRKYFLEAISYVDEVTVFNDDSGLIESIKKHSPDCMIIGSDWKGKKVIGSEHTRSLVFFDRVGEYSTTNILEKK